MALAAARPMPRGTDRTAAAARSGSVVAWCVLAAVGVHAAIGLGMTWSAQPDAATASTSAAHHGADPTGQAQRQAMRLRWVQGTPQSLPEPPLATPSASPTPTVTWADEPAPPAPAPVSAPPEDPAGAMGVTRTASPAAEAPDVNGASPASAAFTGYARRNMLDRGPQALGIVQIGYPPGVAPGQIHRGRLTLFIDEAGAVRKVMVVAAQDAADALPPPFVEAAREAFLQARFAPGERLGVAVKSRIDIEVSFDGREVEPNEAPPPNTAPDRPV